MSRRIGIMTGTGIRFYDLKDVDPPLSIVGEQMYRTDEDYMLRDRTATAEFCLYEKNGLYPFNVQNPPDPDDTMAYIDVMKARKIKLGKAHSRPKWLNQNTILYGIVAIIAGYYIWNHYLMV